MGRRHVVQVGIAMLALLGAIVPLSALAGKPEKAQDKFVNFSYESTDANSNCGVADTLSFTINGVQNYFISYDSAGNPLFKVTGHVTSTITDEQTGNTLIDSFSGAVKDISYVDNGDGTFTVTTQFTGQPFLDKNGDGQVLLKDVGRLVEEVDIDSNENVVGGPRFIFEAGSHPNADSGGTLFCDVFYNTLTS